MSFAQTTNRIVYEGWLDSLATQSPFSDSILSLIEVADSFYTEDLRTTASSIRLPTGNPPTSTAYQGGEVLAFPTNADAKIYFEFQMPHARQDDSDINIHLHYALSEDGASPDSVKWVLTYTWANIDGTIAAPTTVNYTMDVDGEIDSTHYLDYMITITGTGKTYSSVLICSLMRDVSEDAYAGSVYLIELDAHYKARDIIVSTGGIQSSGSTDTTHYTTIGKVIALQDSLNKFLEISDSTVYLTPQDANDGYLEISDSTIYLTPSDAGVGYQPLDADLTDLSDGILTASKVAGVADDEYGDVTVSSGSWVVEDDSHNHVIGNVDVLQDSLTAKLNRSEYSGSTIPKGHIWGLVLSNNGSDASNDIDIAVGQAADEGGATIMVLGGALTKRMDASWAVGTNQGGLNTGSEANSTWYEVHLIRRTDTGVVDVMFTTTGNRATLPAGYTQQRRIGWIYNDGSGNIKAFSQTGNYFTWITQVNDASATMTESATAVTLSAPPYTIALFRASAVSTTSVNETAVIVFSERIEGNVTPASTTGISSLGVEDMASVDAAHFQLRVDASSQIEWDTDNTVATFDISTYGYIDEREQYGNY